MVVTDDVALFTFYLCASDAHHQQKDPGSHDGNHHSVNNCRPCGKQPDTHGESAKCFYFFPQSFAAETLFLFSFLHGHCGHVYPVFFHEADSGRTFENNTTPGSHKKPETGRPLGMVMALTIASILGFVYKPLACFIPMSVALFLKRKLFSKWIITFF